MTKEMKEFAGIYYREGALDPKTMQLVALAAMAAAGQRLPLPSPRSARQAGHVSEAPDHADGEDLDILVAWGRERRPARVLDLATGAGHTALAFAALARRVVAYDVTEPMPSVAQ